MTYQIIILHYILLQITKHYSPSFFYFLKISSPLFSAPNLNSSPLFPLSTWLYALVYLFTFTLVLLTFFLLSSSSLNPEIPTHPIYLDSNSNYYCSWRTISKYQQPLNVLKQATCRIYSILDKITRAKMYDYRSINYLIGQVIVNENLTMYSSWTTLL